MLTFAARAACLASLLVSVPLTSLSSQTVRVVGTVRSAVTGTPVANAVVRVGDTGLSGTTNANGAYLILGVTPGIYELRVTAIGFGALVRLAQEVPEDEGAQVDFELQPLSVRVAHKAEPSGRADVMGSGLGAGVLLGLQGMGGAGNGPVANAVGFDGVLRYGLRSGLTVNAGVHISRHDVESTIYPYRLVGVYLEPRYVANWISPAWAPFIAGQIGPVSETVRRLYLDIRGSGLSLGGGGGVLVRLGPQFAIETGIMAGAVRFGDYTFRGERKWYQCLNLLEQGTPLPESVLQCAGATDYAVVLCYPPFFDPKTTVSGDCDPPDVRYSDTARSATWLRFWLGLHVSLAGPK